MQRVSVATSATVIAMASGGAIATPDIVAGDLNGGQRYGPVNGVVAYGFGSTHCNVGDTPLPFVSNTNEHPVITQNLYRIADGRIEQIGLSFVFHAFCALQSNFCGTCEPVNGACAPALGAGCSDVHSASLHAAQNGLGLRSEVNASTGEFPYPFTLQGQFGDAVYKRLQVAVADLDPALNPGAVYVVEGVYIAEQDAMADKDQNNASYKRVQTLGAQGTNLVVTGQTERGTPAIAAWADHGLGADQPDPGVGVTMYDLPADGVVFAGSNVLDNGDGTYTYYYAIENLSSDRGAQALRVPIPAGANVSNLYFNDVDYHSGEPYDNTDWSASVEVGEVVFRSPATFDEDPNTNALRWGTLYSFGFTTDAEPAEGVASVEYFKPIPLGESEFEIDVLVPAGGPCAIADLAAPFGQFDIADVIEFLRAFGAADPIADFAAPVGVFDIADVVSFLRNFEIGCP